MKTIFITGTAGFIGYHLAQHLLRQGHKVIGYDGLTDYYDVALKRKRHAMLAEHDGFSARIGMLEDQQTLHSAMNRQPIDAIVHLAAQAGVRYSLENPRAYISSNIEGTFNVVENARALGVRHLLMASTSSVYGANTVMPFSEHQQTETPLTLYAATKKANEAMAHSYAHLWNIPTTMFRFFTVYGPWGRPDLALFKFVQAAYAGQPIDVYNHGRMSRDFTYVTDLVRSIALLMDNPPAAVPNRRDQIPGDTLSPAAPFRVVNIGNGKQVSLMHFIHEIENAIGFPIQKNMMEMQKGDVPGTWANSDLLFALTGYRPDTDVRIGIARFIEWYRAYHGVKPHAAEAVA